MFLPQHQNIWLLDQKGFKEHNISMFPWGSWWTSEIPSVFLYPLAGSIVLIYLRSQYSPDRSSPFEHLIEHSVLRSWLLTCPTVEISPLLMFRFIPLLWLRGNIRKFPIKKFWGTCLAQSIKGVTLDLGAMTLSLIFGMEPTLINELINFLRIKSNDGSFWLTLLGNILVQILAIQWSL